MSLSIPVSHGELIDKITILRIKLEKISDPVKLDFIRRELHALEIVAEPFVSKIPTEFLTLKNVNLQLWIIEDCIRVKEKMQEFDSEFVELARTVYKTNDLRCEIKNQINALCASELYEVKSYVS